MAVAVARSSCYLSSSGDGCASAPSILAWALSLETAALAGRRLARCDRSAIDASIRRALARDSTCSGADPPEAPVPTPAAAPNPPSRTPCTTCAIGGTAPRYTA